MKEKEGETKDMEVKVGSLNKLIELVRRNISLESKQFGFEKARGKPNFL